MIIRLLITGQPPHLTFCCPSYGGESASAPQPHEIDQVWQMCSGLLPRLILTQFKLINCDWRVYCGHIIQVV